MTSQQDEPGPQNLPPVRGRGPNAALHEALLAESERLRALGDPVDVVREASDFFAVLDQEVAALVGLVRLEAIAALRHQGWSHQQIADSCGLTRQRVSQLIRDASTCER